MPEPWEEYQTPGASTESEPWKQYQPPAPRGSIDVNALTDPHERDFVEGRRGQLSPDQMEEAIRQYRAIRAADEEQPTMGQMAPLPKIGQDLGLPSEQYIETPRPTPPRPPEPRTTFYEQDPRPTTIPAEPIGKDEVMPVTVPPPQKPWYEPRLTMKDLGGSAGQGALMSGLATSALSPPGLQIPGFIAGSIAALAAEEGTKRLQEQYGEVPGGLMGMGLSAVSGAGVGSVGRTPRQVSRMIPNQGGAPTVVTGPEGSIPPVTGLYSTYPKGGAYAAQEMITPPGSRIAGGPYGQGQFTTGSGTPLFGELQPFSMEAGKPLGWEPKPGTKDTLSPYNTRPTKPKGELPEKLPAIEELPVPQDRYTPPKGIDVGSQDSQGTYIPPKDYRVAPDGPRWRQLWNAEKQKWGQEYPVLKTQPSSPVISAMEGTHVYVEEQIEELVHQPWLKSVMKLGDNRKMAPLEEKWVADFKAGRDYTSGMPQDVRTMLQHRTESLAQENAIRRRRGLPEIHETPGPYLPRISDEDFKLQRMITRSQEGAKRAQSVGPFAEERIYETMREGMAKGVSYQDWRKAMLLREARGYVLKATDQMMTDLEQGGVIFRTKEAAESASLTGKAYQATGLPFEPKGGWWVRSAEERQFLLQNMRSFDASAGEIRSWANQFLRNPSLVNPWPHIMKNMGLKQMQQAIASGLNPGAVLKNTFQYRWGKPDMTKEFDSVMPFTESGRTVWEIMEKAGPKDMVQQLSRVPGVMNGYARKKIFAQWDPAMRYGLWREYVKQGMSPQEAANHTWIDLIRYGTRADRIDAWNSMPFNFFVPWRVGTLRTMNKALQSAPVRFGMWMGAVDLLREADYRYNGRWTHLPYDYLERPIMTLMREGKTEALQTLGSTLLFGPGGDYTIRTIRNIIDSVEAQGGVGTVRTIAWGLAQMWDLYPLYNQLGKGKDGQVVADMLGLVLLGRHGTPYGAPHRFGELVPESMMPKRREVKEAEDFGEGIKQHRSATHEQGWLRGLERIKEPMQPVIPPSRQLEK